MSVRDGLREAWQAYKEMMSDTPALLGGVVTVGAVFVVVGFIGLVAESPRSFFTMFFVVSYVVGWIVKWLIQHRNK